MVQANYLNFFKKYVQSYTNCFQIIFNISLYVWNKELSNYLLCFIVFYSTFTSSNDETVDPADSTINIFSVASGHLYERFLRIMMLSVLKNTKSPLKFWFLKNYLSPTFKVKGKIIVIYLLHAKFLLSSFWYWTDYLCLFLWKAIQLDVDVQGF